MTDAGRLLGLLAEPDRLRVVAVLALGDATATEIATRADLPLPTVVRALTRLQGGELVAAEGAAYRLCTERFREAARAAAEPRPVEDVGTDDPAAAPVLRAFFRDGRLIRIPTARSKRLVVLDHVARLFVPGVRYPEREVSAALRALHDDYAALRRYLVDEHFLSREHGVYWRTGGTVDA